MRGRREQVEHRLGVRRPQFTAVERLDDERPQRRTPTVVVLRLACREVRVGEGLVPEADPDPAQRDELLIEWDDAEQSLAQSGHPRRGRLRDPTVGVLVQYLEGMPHQGVLAGEVVRHQPGGGPHLGRHSPQAETDEARADEDPPHSLVLDPTSAAELRPLEPWQAADFAEYVEEHRADLAEFLPWADSIRDEDAARAFLQRYADRHARDEGRIYGLWEGGAMVGGALFRTFDADQGVAEIGPDAWHRM